MVGNAALDAVPFLPVNNFVDNSFRLCGCLPKIVVWIIVLKAREGVMVPTGMGNVRIANKFFSLVFLKELKESGEGLNRIVLSADEMEIVGIRGAHGLPEQE